MYVSGTLEIVKPKTAEELAGLKTAVSDFFTEMLTADDIGQVDRISFYYQLDTEAVKAAKVEEEAK